MGLSFRFLFRSYRLEILLKAIETFFPENAVLLDPVDRILEGSAVQLAGAPLGLPRLGDEPSLLQHLEMLGDGRETHRFHERLSQLRDIRFALREASQDGSSRRVCQGCEGLA